MTKSILKSDKGSQSSVGQDANSSLSVSAPVSVVVDVVNHDEPSVSSVMSNGAAASLHDSVSIARTVIFPHQQLKYFQKRLDTSRHRVGTETLSVSSYNLGWFLIF